MATRGQCVENSRFYLRGTRPAMATIAVFDDMACSTPTKVTFVQHFGCSVQQDALTSVCRPNGPTQYSISGCTRDYSTLIDTMFGYQRPYLMVETHINSWCGALQSVTTYAADGLCHTNIDDGTSVQVVLNSDGSGTIKFFSDSWCSQTQEIIDVSKQMVLMYLCVQDNWCNSLDGSCSKRYSVGGFGGPSAKGEMTAVSVYDSSSCSQPAATMELTRTLFCFPQGNSWHPNCEDNGRVRSISDCTVYFIGGSDSNYLVDQAFGSTPYIVVEEFDTSMGSCGDVNALIKTTVYRPDDECHTNYDRTQSTRLLFRDSRTIVKYDDPECTILSSEMEVTWEDALYGLCVGGNTTVFYQNYGSPDLTAVTVFEDNECSEKPVKITFTMWFGKCNTSEDPGNSVCAPHGSSYHSVSCTPYYYDFASTTFSSNPYLLVAEFAGKSCTRLQSVVAYIADGSCHTNTGDTTSFMAIISEKSSASITTYIDSSCNIIDETTLINKRQLTETWLWSCYGSTSCNAGQSLCNKKIAFGGLSGSRSYGLMTAVVTYGTDSSCSQRAKKVSFTLELMCNSQSNNWNVVCEDIEGQHYVSYCTRYWSEGYDEFGLLGKAFGWPTAYLLVEEYDDSLGYCGDGYVLYNAVAYFLDEECQTNRDGKTSSQLMVGHSVTITKFADPLCTVITSQTEVSFRSARRRSCISSSRFTFRGPIPDLTAVAVFDDSLCSSNPVKLAFSQDFVCSAPQYPEKTTCGVDGTTLYSVSSCTSDHSGLTNEVFDTPYIKVEEFLDSWCGGIERVAVYVADGACHTNTDDTTSFRATIRSEGSATIITYSDPACMSVDDDVKFTSQNSNWCTPYTNECNDEDGYGCSKRFSVGGLGGQPSNGRMKSVVLYNNESCTNHAVTVSFTKEWVCTPQNDSSSPKCEDNGTFSSISDCTDYHRGGPYDWFLERYLGYNPNMYVLLEVYDKSCAFDFNLNNATAYLLDEECHSHSGTKSTKLSLGLSLTITEFDDPNCNEISIVREVPFMAAKNYDCIDDQVIAYLRGGIPDLTVKAIFADSTCSGVPAKLAFTQYFKCEKPTTASCEQVSVNHFSVSDCTRDYVGVIANSFGSQNPYVMIEEFSDQWCGQVQNVSVYAADGVCHSNLDGTSFRATIGSDKSATITTYIDMNCKTIEDKTEVPTWKIMWYACVVNNECGADPYGCSRRYSVGGVNGSPSLGKMVGTIMFGDSSCSQPAETVSLTRDLICNPKTDNETPVCEDNGIVYSVSHCVNVTDASNTYQLLDEAFGWRSHLAIEEYDTSLGSCGDSNALTGVTAYLLDEKCHVNSFDSGSSQLRFGASLSITKYSDKYCSTQLSETKVTWEMIRYNSCYNDARYYLRGPVPNMTAVAVFNDNKCSTTPVKLTLTQLIGCNAGLDSRPICSSDGSDLYTISSCVGDHTEFAAKAFGKETPYLIETKFMDSWCGKIDVVTVYIADGSCHTNNDATSFMVTLATGGEATVATFFDADCSTPKASNNINVGNDTSGTACLSGSVCIKADGSECSKKFMAGGLAGSQSVSSQAIIVYDDSSCGEEPVQLVITNQVACSLPASSSCLEVLKGKNMMYQDSTCITDVAEFAASSFGTAPYLLVENFVTGSSCRTQQGAVVYKADGKCYSNVKDGTSFRILPNVGGSVTIATYPTSACKDFEADYITIGAKYLGTNACYEGNLRVYANMTGLLTPTTQTPAKDVDYQAREKIMFPDWLWEPTPRRVFVSS